LANQHQFAKFLPISELVITFLYGYLHIWLLTVLNFVDVVDMPVVAIKDTNSESLVQYSTPDEASIEFGILLQEILEELEKNKTSNLLKLQTISSALTVQNNSKVRVFTDRQLEEIWACNSIPILLMIKLRHCYRWDDFSMLTKLMSSLKSEKCLHLLESFEVKIKSEMKLQHIYEYCIQKGFEFPGEYHKIIAIVHNKIFSDITKQEYDVLKHFVSQQCGVEAYVISPIIKAFSSSLILEWFIPVTAVTHMTETASNNKGNFIEVYFVYLKISSTVIFDCRDNVSNFTVMAYNMCMYVYVCIRIIS